MPKKDMTDKDQLSEIVAGEMARVVEQLEILVESSHRIENLLRISVQPTVQGALAGIFRGGKQIRAYELSDGQRSTRQIAEIVGVDQKTISTWWRTWEKMGITEKYGVRGQFRGRYSLVDLIAMYTPERLSSPVETYQNHKELEMAE